MDLLNGSSTNAHFEPTLERRQIPEVDMCSDVSAATQRASSPGGDTSPSLTVSKRDELDMRDIDHEACAGACEPSSHRHPVVVGPPDMDHLQDTPEILAPWFHLTPDEAFEQCFQLDDVDSLLENGSCLGNFQLQPQFDCSSDSGNSENSDTISPSVSMEIRDDQTICTTSSDSVGISTHMSPGKRKCRERAKIVEAEGNHCEGVEPVTQPKHSMNGGGQGRHLRKRLSSSEKSTRYTIKTATDVDIIDDGYRWRKYGQKPVKNSDHPRSYYRCTAPNCPVRKQVERCTENPHNVLTTYDGKHNHPKSPSPGMRESIPEGLAEDLPSSSPIRPHDGYLGPPARLPPSNYMSQTLLDHVLPGALLDGPGWPNGPPQGGSSFSQGNINLLRAQQLFMLQCQRQYPFFSGMLNLVQNYPLAQSPVLDPRLALLAAQNYSMRLRAQANSDRSAAIAAQRAPRFVAPLSRTQLRLLRLQELMGENRYSGDVHQSQQQTEPSIPRGLGNLDSGDV